MSAEFVQADSTNLPEINLPMILEYFQSSEKFNAAEVRGVKASMASRSGYVDNAVGYVEIKRTNTQCTLRAKVVPEHKITTKYYQVTVHTNEENQIIVDTECDGCSAAAGGCKHTLVVLFWMEKQTSKPSPTSTECYWKKPRLASEGTQPIYAEEITKGKRNITLDARDPEKLKYFYDECKKRRIKGSLITSFQSDHDQGLSKYCIFDMALEFAEKSNDHNYDVFKTFMSKYINRKLVEEIEQATSKQSDSKLWHNIRQGRITGSKIYEVCHCNTPDGSLVEQILGGYKMYETKAMKRGKALEKLVVKEIETKLKSKIHNCGFSLINLICGASPDGVSKDFIVEIKCPTTKKAVKSYMDGDEIKEKFFAQCQLQMLATGYKKCAFCMADPKFEENKKIKLVWVEFDPTYVNNILVKAEEFWKTNIYPKIILSVKS